MIGHWDPIYNYYDYSFINTHFVRINSFVVVYLYRSREGSIHMPKYHTNNHWLGYARNGQIIGVYFGVLNVKHEK